MSSTVKVRPLPHSTLSKNRNAYQFYYDDIRAYPLGGIAATTYYDDKWQKTVLCVGTANNPGQKVTYDNFGRPVTWQKFSPTNYSDLINVRTKAYKFVEGVVSPSKGEIITNGATIRIYWNSSTTMPAQASILLSADGGTTYPITIAANAPNFGYYDWTPTGLASGTMTYKIMISGTGLSLESNLFSVP
jgi:hypothetical protein